MAPHPEPARRRAKNNLNKDLAMAFKEAANERIFLMKDLAAVGEAMGLGAKIYEGASPF